MGKSKFLAALCAASLLVTATVATTVMAQDNNASTASEYTAKYQLTNENADENTQRTYDYICEMFGKNILSAQQESTWMDGGNADYEMDIIEEATGKLPAIRGLDFMNGDFDGVVQRAKEWHEQGGIVTIMWHTGVNGRGYTESLNDNPDFDLILTEGTPEYEAMIATGIRLPRL